MRDIKEYLLSKADCSTIAKLASASIKGTRCFSKSLPSIKQELAGRLSSCEETCNYINWTSRLFLFIKYCYIRLIATECFKREFHSSPLKIKIIKKKKKKRNETINRHAIYPKVNLSSIFFFIRNSPRLSRSRCEMKHPVHAFSFNFYFRKRNVWFGANQASKKQSRYSVS